MKKYKVVGIYKRFPIIDLYPLEREFDNEAEAKECAKHWKAIGYEVEITKREVIKDESSNNV